MYKESLIALLLIIVLFIACIPFVQSYADEIKNNENVSSAMKTFISFVPLLLAITVLFLSFTAIYIAVKKR